jgi:hypothetical protein
VTKHKGHSILFEVQLRPSGKKFKAYSIAVVESTDVERPAQLAASIRCFDSHIAKTEELFELIPIHRITIG